MGLLQEASLTTIPQGQAAPRFGDDRDRVSLGLELERTNQFSLNVDSHNVGAFGIAGCDCPHVVDQNLLVNGQEV